MDLNLTSLIIWGGVFLAVWFFEIYQSLLAAERREQEFREVEERGRREVLDIWQG